MDYRRLGRTGLQVSAIGLGGGGIGHVWGPTTGEGCKEVVSRAIDVGVNFFDVTPHYGRGKAEQVLGEAARGRRGQCYFATKISAEPSVLGKEFEAVIRALVRFIRYAGWWRRVSSMPCK